MLPSSWQQEERQWGTPQRRQTVSPVSMCGQLSAQESTAMTKGLLFLPLSPPARLGTLRSEIWVCVFSGDGRKTVAPPFQCSCQECLFLRGPHPMENPDCVASSTVSLILTAVFPHSRSGHHLPTGDREGKSSLTLQGLKSCWSTVCPKEALHGICMRVFSRHVWVPGNLFVGDASSPDCHPCSFLAYNSTRFLAFNGVPWLS